MKKRIFLTVIWAYVAWYATVFAAAYLGLTEAIGPIVGALVGAMIWFAPLGVRRGAESRAPVIYGSTSDRASTH